MKRYRSVCAIVSLALLISLVTGCAWIGTEEPTAAPTTTAPTTATPTTTAPVTVDFPLESEVSLTLTAYPYETSANLQKALSNCMLWNDLYERTNVKIEIKECADVDTLASLLNTDDYGDIILLGSFYNLTESMLSDMIEQKKLLALNPYISNSELMPNLNSRVWDERPEAKGIFTSPDGNIYALGSLTTEPARSLEYTCWVNKTWVEDAGMTIEDLATLDGLEKFFGWVKKNDANGNGDPDDELPYMCYPSGSTSIETLLGMWGIPTKDRTSEGYCFLENGQVKFAPLTQNWIDFMTTMKKWFDNGWAYEDYLLGHDGDGKPLYEHRQNQYVRDNGEPERIAFWVGTGAPARNNGTKLPGVEMCEYVSILPPKVEGYETRWYISPTYMGTKGRFAISANCENPEIALAWMDQFYSQEVTIRYNYGEPDSNLYYLDDDGKIAISPPRSDPSPLPMPSLDSIIPRFPDAITEDDYKNVFSTDGATQKRRDAYAQYQDIVNTEVWPRPYMTSSTLSEHTALYAEISQIIAKYRNDWLSGKGDPSTDRDQFEAELKAAGVDRMVALMQEAYDVFRNAIDE